jgi:hypothetical protein
MGGVFGSLAPTFELGDLRNLAPKPTPPYDHIQQGGVAGFVVRKNLG